MLRALIHPDVRCSCLHSLKTSRLSAGGEVRCYHDHSSHVVTFYKTEIVQVLFSATTTE